MLCAPRALTALLLSLLTLVLSAGAAITMVQYADDARLPLVLLLVVPTVGAATTVGGILRDHRQRR